MTKTANPTVLTGRCGCGAVSFRVEGEPNWVAHCHCRDCRAQTGSPFTTYAGFPNERFAWTGERPKTHASSAGVRRSFCPQCGTPMLFEGERWPDEVHIFVATLENPASLAPRGHVYFGQALPWIEPADGLPRFNTTARDGPPLP
jgi:hypothetical protein